MKKIFLIATLFFSGFGSAAHSLELFNDEYRETNNIKLHTTGLFTYGLHSNTYHLRFYYFKFDYNLEDIQFFIAFNGYKDTHNPDTNYSYIINNINLYDYGVTYWLFNRFFLSMRGAAVYRKNTDTYLLMPCYYSPANPAEFDSPDQYMPTFIPNYTDPPGIRLGYMDDHFEIGYSQGDFQHAIPIAGILRYFQENFYARITIQRVNYLPQTYVITDFYWIFQFSTAGYLTFGDWKFSALGEITLNQQNPGDGRKWLRFEQAVEFLPLDITLGIREMWRFDLPFLFEASIMKEVAGIASLGFFASTDGRMYIGTEVKF